MMAYEIFTGIPGSEWRQYVPEDTLKAMLDEHPEGVSFISHYGDEVRWRKRPRDGQLYKAISDAIAGRGDHKGVTPTDRVYDLLEGRGIV